MNFKFERFLIAVLLAAGFSSSVYSYDIYKAGDSRQTGTFTFALGDTQKITAQEPPIVNCAGLDKEIILDWGSDPDRVAATEGFNQNGFKFEGYNIYQLPTDSSKKSAAVKIATYDLKNGIQVITGIEIDPQTGAAHEVIQQFGYDFGIRRNFRITKNYLTDQPLENGKEYCFAVTAYSYNPDPQAVPNNIENPLMPIKIIPLAPEDGGTYKSHFGDTVTVARFSGKADTRVVALVVNPKALTGHTYQVSFDTTRVFNKQYGSYDIDYKWKVTDLTKNEVKLSGQTNLTGDEAYLTMDGLEIKVIGASNGVKSEDSLSTRDRSKWGWSIPSGEHVFSWMNSVTLGLEGFRENIGAGATWMGSSVGYDEMKNVLIKFAAADSNGNVSQNDPDVSFAYRYLRNASLTPAKPEFTPYIINKGKDYAYQDFRNNFPFAAYDVEDPLHPRRLAVGYLENNVTNGSVDDKYWPPVAGIENVSQYSPREWFFIFDTNYSEIQDTRLTKSFQLGAGTMPILLHGTVTRKSSKAWTGNDEMAIYVNHMPSPQDVFRINTDYLSAVKSQEIPLKYELSQNYPNPFNPVTNIRYTLSERSHVELKIFDMLGREVTTLVNKEQIPGHYTVQFDGKNLSSGIYIYRLQSNNFTRSSKMILLK